MVITDVYQQVTLNGDVETYVQNLSEMRIRLRISTLIPTDDVNSIKVYPTTRSDTGDYIHKNSLGNLWVRVVDDDYNAEDTYEITVI